MNKIALYLQEHLSGEIITNKSAIEHFSTDASIFKVTPSVIIYPMNTVDVRKVVKFSHELATKGKLLPITARGSGTDQSGAAIGNGLLLVFPAHLDKLLELNTKYGEVKVEPGLNYGKLQQTLLTHDLFLPPSPASMEYSTIGGAIANNAGGDKSVKYGKTLEYVKSLQVVLSNGDLIETKRISKKELHKKLGQSNLEGEIYRSIDRLIEENADVINSSKPMVTKNSSGYNIHLVKGKDGSFDLTPLFVGSQGTLGIITEATLLAIPRRPKKILTLISLNDLKELGDVLDFLKNLKDSPSAIELVDDRVLNFVKSNNPNLLKNIFSSDISKYVLIVEFDNPNDRLRVRLSKKLEKYLTGHNLVHETSDDPIRIDDLWKFRRSTTAVIGSQDGNSRPLPIIEDGIVSPDKFVEFIESVCYLLSQNDVPIFIYGHAGDGQLHLQPSLDLSQVGDRQKMFKLMIEYYNLIKQFNGSISADHGDGRLRAPFIYPQYGEKMYQIIKQIKKIFDPYGILNTGVKFTDDLQTLKTLLRNEYNTERFYDYFPYI
jgi:FAD/FMN-containing dehydrogenase